MTKYELNKLYHKENIAFGLFAGIMFVIGYLLLLETCLLLYICCGK